jgi:hypothetical protein
MNETASFGDECPPGEPARREAQTRNGIPPPGGDDHERDDGVADRGWRLAGLLLADDASAKPAASAGSSFDGADSTHSGGGSNGGAAMVAVVAAIKRYREAQVIPVPQGFLDPF